LSVLPPTLSRLAALALTALPALAGAPSEPAKSAPIDVPTALATFDVVWATVDARHFDPEHGGVDWRAVRDELRPRAGVRDRAELRTVLREMLDRLGQSHFALIPREDLPDPTSSDDEDQVAGGIGIDVRAIADELVVTRVDAGSPAARAGVRSGWIVSAIDGKTSIGMFERYRDPDPRETAFRVWRKARRATYGAVGTDVELTLIDERGDLWTQPIERAERDVVPFVSHDLPTFHLSFASGIVEHGGRRIGWVRFSNWFEPTAERFDEAMKSFAGCDGVLIDLRGNTGGAGHLIGRVAGHFFDEKIVLGRQRMRVGSFAYKVRPAERTFHGPLALVVDATTSSSSEVFAGGLQAVGRAHVVGETTAGAVLPATTRLLPSGDALLYAIADFQTADGTVLEGRGVEPDHAVELRRSELLDGRDAQLEAALAWIAGEARPTRLASRHAGAGAAK